MASGETSFVTRCPRCFFPTPIPPSTHETQAPTQRVKGMGNAISHVACIHCARVYSYVPPGVRQIPTTELHQHYNLPSGVSLCTFSASISCEERSCGFRLLVTSARRSDTSTEYETEIRKEWKWKIGENDQCDYGHKIPLPPV
jgi:hypothetical protein